MSILQEALTKIRSAGVDNTRIVPVSGTGKVNLDVKENGQWVTVLKLIDRKMAEDALVQSKDRVIFG